MSDGRTAQSSTDIANRLPVVGRVRAYPLIG